MLARADGTSPCDRKTVRDGRPHAVKMSQGKGAGPGDKMPNDSFDGCMHNMEIRRGNWQGMP